jgi:hypothetical protein
MVKSIALNQISAFTTHTTDVTSRYQKGNEETGEDSVIVGRVKTQ